MMIFPSLNHTESWQPYKALRPAENLALADAKRLVYAIQQMGLPVPSLWLGTETDPMIYSPSDFAANGGPIGDPLNWKLSWQVPPDAPDSQRDRGKEEYAAADFARALQACGAGNEGALGEFAAKVLNAQGDNRTFLTAQQGFLELLSRNPDARSAALQAILRKAVS